MVNLTRTLDKFGVPVSGSNKIGMLQPKPQHRWRVLVTNFGDGNPNEQKEITRQMKSVGRPNVQYNPVVVDSYNSKMWYCGKHTWQAINFSMYDDITQRASNVVGQQIQKQLDHVNQVGFPTGQSYKFQMCIQTLDGSDTGVVENFFCEGCWLVNINYGQGDYASDAPFMLECSVQYDNMTLEEFRDSPLIRPGGDGFGFLIPQAPNLG